MEFEIPFNGPPEHFLEMIDLFTAKRLWENDLFRWMVHPEGLNFVYHWNVLQEEETGAWIKAQHAPNNKSRLIIHSPDDKWSMVEPWWNLLYEELIRQGWIATPSNTSEATLDKGKNIKVDGQPLLPSAEIIESTKVKSQQPLKSKRGQRRYSLQKMLEAVEEWDSLDRDEFTPTLSEWLVKKFGTEYGMQTVANSTFHGWRQRLIKRGLYKKS